MRAGSDAAWLRAAQAQCPSHCRAWLTGNMIVDAAHTHIAPPKWCPHQLEDLQHFLKHTTIFTSVRTKHLLSGQSLNAELPLARLPRQDKRIRNWTNGQATTKWRKRGKHLTHMCSCCPTPTPCSHSLPPGRQAAGAEGNKQPRADGN